MKKAVVIFLTTALSGCALLSSGIYSVSFPKAEVRGIAAGHYGKVTVDQKPGPLSEVRIRLGLRNAGSGLLKTDKNADSLLLRSKTGTEFPVDLKSLPEDPYNSLSVPPGGYIAYDLKVSNKPLIAMILNNEMKEMEWRIGQEGTVVMKAYYPDQYAVV